MGYDKLGDNIILIYTNISYITLFIYIEYITSNRLDLLIHMMLCNFNLIWGVGVFMILFYFEWVRELVSDCNVSYVMARTTYIQRDHNCVRFYAYCWFYFNGSSLKENSPLVNIVASFERNILIPYLILLISNGCLVKKQQILILLSVVWSEQGLFPWSTKFEVSTLIITQQMWLFFKNWMHFVVVL